MNLAVNFNSVSFSYSDIQVLDNASFHIHKGEFVAMVGPNGSGKTTVLKLLLGLEKPAKGAIEIFGSAAYVSQQMPSDNLFPITVRDIVRMGNLSPLGSYSLSSSSNKSASAVEQALENTGIADLAQRQYRSLSGGQKRRTLVARALAANPDLLVLDEPTANMDRESETLLYEALGAYKGKTAILVVTHDTEFVSSLTDRVLCLGDSKKIVQHGVELSAIKCHGDTEQQARVLHGASIECCDSNN